MMEPWSDLPVRERFRIKFYLDTNILTYLVDNTYPCLTKTIIYLKDSEFADLVSSKYVIFEFVGVRKKEHFLRKAYTQLKITPNVEPNMSSLLKYKERFETGDVKYETVKDSVKQSVFDEIKVITQQFEIDYENNLIHDSLLAPTFEITLISKISREDSLVLASAVWPSELSKEKFVFLMSNDDEFVKNCSEPSLIEVFEMYKLCNPHVECIKSMQINNLHKLNLTSASDENLLIDYLPNKLKELIIKKNELYYLGKTISCGRSVNFPVDLVCFKLKQETSLNNNLYLTIIGKNLDFIYSTKLRVNSFWDQTEIMTYPFKNTIDTDISFRPMEDNNGTSESLPQNVIERLREPGNLVFINPDDIEIV